MERESNQMQALCRSGCGFYGSPATDGLCSICYKEHLKKKQQLPTNTPASLSSYRDTSATAAAQSTVGNTLHNTTNLPECLHTTSKDSLSHEGTATTTTTTTNVSNPDTAAIIPSSSSSCDGEQSSPSRSSIATAAAAVISSIVEDSANLSANGCDDKDDGEDKDSDSDAKKKKKNRCATCRKKVGLTGFECRCGGQYCAVHRYSDKHDCSFNYREMGAQEIRRNNPVVVGEKIQKI